MSSPTLASDGNLWQSSFGQRWFYETRSDPNELLAGTWWEHSLERGTTYRIEFQVNTLRGRMTLLAGDNPALVIDQPGEYGVDFAIQESTSKRLLFRTASPDVLAGVNAITVSALGSGGGGGPGQSGGGASTPRGHYISFASNIALRSEVTHVLDNPQSYGAYRREQAQKLADAFRTPGVKGLWIPYRWRDVETGDAVYDWRAIDANMQVAARFGLKKFVAINDRSFDGEDALPGYFPNQYRIWTNGLAGHHGTVAKKWDPWVYNRVIRLYRKIHERYRDHPAYAGIATSETALGEFWGGNYSVAAYTNALVQIATRTNQFMDRGKLLLYLNFIKDGQRLDLRHDARWQVAQSIPQGAIVIGAPDLTPDVSGMPGSVTSYRVQARTQRPGLAQFCHAQHVDQGLRDQNRRSNVERDEVRQRAAELADDTPGAVVRFAKLLDPHGNWVDRHPPWTEGRRWTPQQLIRFGVRNFDCQYFIWHYRDWGGSGEYDWQDVRPAIVNNQHFYD